MSQMTSLQKAPKAAWKGRILQNTAQVTDRKAHAPVGRGSSTRPASRLSFASCFGRQGQQLEQLQHQRAVLSIVGA